MIDDAQALAERLESFRNYLLLLARARVNDRLRGLIDPADLVQQTLARAFERRHQFQGSTDAQRAAWLRTLLTHTLIDALRKAGSQPLAVRSLEQAIDQSSARLESFLAADQTSPSDRFERQEQLLRLSNALAALPEDQRRAIELKHLQGHSVIDVAAQMGRTVPAVAGLLQRAMKTLRAELGDLWERGER